MTVTGISENRPMIVILVSYPSGRFMERTAVLGNNRELVILSEAKDHLALHILGKMILRFAQDDKFWRFL